jgi:hypothetical protein
MWREGGNGRRGDNLDGGELIEGVLRMNCISAMATSGVVDPERGMAVSDRDEANFLEVALPRSLEKTRERIAFFYLGYF